MTLEQARETLGQIKYKRARFYVQRHHYLDEIEIRVILEVPDVFTGVVGPLNVPHTILPERLADMNEEELIRFVFRLVQTAEEHEMREWFTFRGEQIFDPHKNEPGYEPSHKPVTEYPKFETPAFASVRAAVLDSRNTKKVSG